MLVVRGYSFEYVKKRSNCTTVPRLLSMIVGDVFLTGIMRSFRSNCPRGVQKRISLDAAIRCSKSEAHFSGTARER